MKQSELKIKFNTQLGPADESTVDKWELMASRRALQNLRELLYGEKMQDLIQEQMNENDERIRQYLKESKGEFKEVFVEVEVEGITASEYFSWQKNAMKKAITGTENDKKTVVTNIVFPAHPEHYLLAESGVVETLGGLPTNASIAKVDMPQFVLDAIDNNYIHDGYSGVKLQDGTIWAYGLTEYKDTEKGASMKLRVWWPAKAPQQFFDDHNRHFAVEYRNFIHMAFNDLNK